MINKLLQKKGFGTLIIAVMVLLAAVSLVQGVRNAARDSQDFQWDAMKVFSLRINPYDESMNPTGVLDTLGYEEYYLQMEANQFPSLLMLLIPFAPLSPLGARYVWIICNLIFTGLIVILLRKTFLKDMNGYLYTLLSLLMIAGTPYRNQIGVGQHTLFAFCFFLAAVWYSEYRENRSSLLTVLALFICYFKYTLTVPLVLYFVYKKRYKEIIISAFMHVVLTVVSAFWLSDSVMNMIIKPLKVSSALSAEGGLDISALMGGSPAALLTGGLVMIVLFTAAVRMPEGMDRTFFSALVLWSVIITYHRTYDFFVIVAAAGFFLERGIGVSSTDTSAETAEENKVSFLNYLNMYYIVVMFAVFFVLRVFSENTASKISVGAFYYILTMVITAYALKTAFGRNIDK